MGINVQISKDAFLDGLQLALFVLADAEPEHIEDVAKRVATEYGKKLDSIIRRDLFTKYKTAPTEEQQEAARREYIEKAGISPSFRW